MNLKLCSDCHEPKPETDFYRQRNGQPFDRCKPCHNAVSNEWRRHRKAAQRSALLRHEGFSSLAQSFYTQRRTA